MNIEKEIGEIESSVSHLNKNLQSEVNNIRKRKKLTMFLSPVILLMVLSYCVYIYSFISRVLNPQEVASYFRVILASRIYNSMPQIEKYLIESAPELTEKLVDDVIRGIPSLRHEAQNNIDTMAEIFVNRLTARFIYSFHDILMENKEAIKTVPQMLDKQNIYFFAEQLAKEIKLQLDTSAEIDLPELAKSISNINGELKNLLKDDSELTEEQKLEKRFVKLLLQLMDQEKINFKWE